MCSSRINPKLVHLQKYTKRMKMLDGHSGYHPIVEAEKRLARTAVTSLAIVKLCAVCMPEEINTSYKTLSN